MSKQQKTSPPELRALTPKQRSLLRTEQPVIAARVTWLAVHGAICLALRHPQMTGPSRVILQQFAATLGAGFVEWGILTPRELDLIQRTEELETEAGGTNP